MCDECGAIICAIFDRMIARELSLLGADIGTHRGVHPTNVAKATGVSDTNDFHRLVGQSMDIGLTPQEMETELIRRTGYPDAVSQWIKEKKIPCGLVRKIILTNVEAILRERGARPARSAKELAAAA